MAALPEGQHRGEQLEFDPLPLTFWAHRVVDERLAQAEGPAQLD